MTKKGLVILLSGIFLWLLAEPIQALSWQHIQSTTGILPAPQTSDQQTASLILDIDKDGDNDFVIASRKAPNAVVWYRRNNNGWGLYVIDDASLRIEAGGDFFDVDNDGDLDVTFAADNQTNFIYWWENPAPNFSPTQKWNRHTIKASGANKHHDLVYGDVDGDNTTELVYWNQGEPGLFVSEIPANPKNSSNWPRTKIYTSTPQHEGLDLYDIDGDGKLDIVGGGLWFKHTGGTSYQVNTIDNSRAYSRTAVGQLIPGGRPEVVLSAGDEAGTLDMYSWNGNSWTKQFLTNIDHGHSLEIADMDGNGTLDIFSAEMRVNGTNPTSKVRLLLNNGNGNFATEIAATGYDNHESKVGDLDGDGDLDILGKPYNFETPKVNVWLRTDNPPAASTSPRPSPSSSGGGGLDEWQRHVIDNARPHRALFVESTDVDGDSKKDIVTGGWWYKNPGLPSGNWGARRTIGTSFNNMVEVDDFDGDGDQDLLGSKWNATGANNELVWAQNSGSGNFAIKTNVSPGVGDFLQGVVVDTFPQKKIALSWHKNGGGVQMLALPANPVTQTWTHATISSTNLQEDLASGDIDRDGDKDLLLGTSWLRNNGANWSSHTLFASSLAADRNELVDVNGDGKLDSVVGYESPNQPGKLAWYQQGNDATASWTERVISNQVVGPMSLDAADLDGDGDVDVVVGEHYTNDQTANARLLIFENRGGGTNWQQHVVYTGDEHHDGARLTDIDGDGDLDIMSIGWTHGRVVLYENKNGGGSVPPVTPSPRPSVPPSSSPVPFDFDFNADSQVTFVDLKELLLRLMGSLQVRFDTDGDGSINSMDFVKMLPYLPQNFVSPPPEVTPRPSPRSSPQVSPSNSPLPSPSGPSGAGEKVLFNLPIQFVSTDNGFHYIHMDGTPFATGIPTNWKQPVDYFTGTWQYRIRVTQHPTGQEGRLQMCLWNMPGHSPENCAFNIQYATPNTYTYASNPSINGATNGGWARIDGSPALDFLNPLQYKIGMILRGPGNCVVTTKAAVSNKCPELWDQYKDLRFDLTVVMVPGGQGFSGWENYP